MLRIIQSKSAMAAKSYYSEGLSKEDYYSEEQEIIGKWGGKAAELLGLLGQVGKKEFDALADNLHPTTGERLTARMNKERTVGYDINFHCPKSVSVVYAMTGDENILRVFRDAVDETMQEMEQQMATKAHSKDKHENRTTGNMVWGEFIHFTARPVGGVPDPHLHAHCFTFNATYDATAKKWKAGQWRDIKRDAPFYEACFHARFARKLNDLGYGIERTKKGWEIAGMSPGVIERFSRRTEQIEKIAKEKGVTSQKEKDGLGARTREGKRKGLGYAGLKQEWNQRLTREERRDIVHIKTHRGATPMIKDSEAMDYAAAHGFERASVISEKDLMRQALKYGVGSVLPEGIKAQVTRGDILAAEKNGKRLATTRHVLQEEKAMIAFALAGRGTCKALGSRKPEVRNQESGKVVLTEEQRAAVEHVLSSRDRVIAIRGGAGTGKTTLMQEAVRGIEANGHQVFTFAPSAQASRGVLQAEGFGNATTVAELLANKALQEQAAGQVIWIDEAGLVGSKTMKQVFDLAAEKNCRVVLSGDYYQHAPVERGAALKILVENGGVNPAVVSGIQRQKGGYKEAVEELSKGDAAAGFDKLDRLGAVVEVTGDKDRYTRLAKDYTQAVAEGKTVLVVSPTHAESAAVTDAIRTELKQTGLLGKEEKPFTQLKNLQWTEAQKTDAALYEVGQVVQFNQNAKGFARGEKATVIGKDEAGAVYVARNNGALPSIAPLPLKEAGRFTVYEPGAIVLAKSDKLRIAQNGYSLPDKDSGKTHRLNNGMVAEVAGFTAQGNIKLKNGWVLSKEFGHVTRGFCATSHASQGATVDRVLIAQSAKSAPASSREQFYVSASRGREQVKIYTDDKQALKEAVAGSRVGMSAMELFKQEPQPEKQANKKELWKKQAETINRRARQMKQYTAKKPVRPDYWTGKYMKEQAVKDHTARKNM